MTASTAIAVTSAGDQTWCPTLKSSWPGISKVQPDRFWHGARPLRARTGTPIRCRSIPCGCGPCPYGTNACARHMQHHGRHMSTQQCDGQHARTPPHGPAAMRPRPAPTHAQGRALPCWCVPRPAAVHVRDRALPHSCAPQQLCGSAPHTAAAQVRRSPSPALG